MKKPRTSFVFLFLILAFGFCSPPYSSEIVGYRLNNPKSKITLPGTLHEISGITELSDQTVACVQDEHGVVFIYDIVKKSIVDSHNFGPDGDYEGIARAGKKLFMLRSDGLIFELDKSANGELQSSTIQTTVPAVNNEGLCFDAASNRLLIGCKSKAGKGPEYKDRRSVYALDLETKQTSAEPVFDFNVQEIIAFAQKNNIRLPEKTKKKSKETFPVLKFSTSEIAIHPKTRHLYLLSAADHMLMVFDMQGTIREMALLDPAVFNKPEGITFMANGDMLITNEGQDKKPTLLIFDYKNQ